jgi:hypothetical protein
MIVLLTLMVGITIIWLAFSHDIAARITHKSLLPVLFVLGALAIYPLYRLGKSWPAFAWGINFVLVGFFLTISSAVGPWIGLSGTWTEILGSASEALYLIGMVILVLKAATKGQHNLKT